VDISVLRDQRLVGQLVQQGSDGVRKNFTVKYTIMSGEGIAQPTYDPQLIQVYVGTDPVDARLAGPVQVLRITPDQEIILRDPPPVGLNVFVDYYTSFLVDAEYVIECTTSGGAGVGKFTIRDEKERIVPQISWGSASITESAVWINEGGVVHPQTGDDLRVTPGASIPETITVEFTSSSTFNVTSSDVTNGTNGVGSLNQTFFHSGTGVLFTIMKGITNYQTGDTIQIDVSNNDRIADPSLRILDIVGIELKVPTLVGVAPTSKALLETFRKDGQEPEVGSFYFVTYLEGKKERDYETKYWSKHDLDLLFAEYGDPTMDNELSLAAKICFEAGADYIETIQTRIDSLTMKPSTDEMRRSIIEAEREPLSDPFYIIPLTDDENHIALWKQHSDKMSTLRYSRPRLLVCTNKPSDTHLDVLATLPSRKSVYVVNMWPCDPVRKMTSYTGIEQEYVVPSYMMCAAYAGIRANPVYDAGEPLTRKIMPQFIGLVTKNDPIKLNLMASRGCTVVENFQGTLRIRDEVTTDNTSVTRSEVPATTTGIYLVYIIKQALDKHIGRKELRGINTDIKRDVSVSCNALIPNMLHAVHSVNVFNVDGDPTMRAVEVECTPVLTMKRIVVKFFYRFS